MVQGKGLLNLDLFKVSWVQIPPPPHCIVVDGFKIWAHKIEEVKE